MSVAHIASVAIETPVEFAFDQLSDARSIGQWALGSMDLNETKQPNVFIGKSLFDGTDSVVEIRPDAAQGLIDFRTGTLKKREPRISIRLTAGYIWGYGGRTCLAEMTTWRAGWMDDTRWARTRTTHELEVLLFKSQIETAWLAQAA